MKHRIFLGNENALHDTKMIDTYSVQQQENSSVNCGLQVIMACQCRLISCNKFTTLVEDVDNGRGYVCRGENLKLL